MGLASALSTALTGLTASETTIDVVGNNLANSNTVGFKASTASFSTQFLQTLSLGSQPSGNSGGTNPRQVGLGTMVSDITPNFNQGTLEISSNPTDLAIQGDGFFMVEGSQGETLYTRNGIFKFNSQNEMVTITGNRLMGFGIDDQFQIQRTTLVPIEIPLGAAAVAQPTSNVFLEGTLSPTGDIATEAQRIQTGILGDGSTIAPTAFGRIGSGTAPLVGTSNVANTGVVGAMGAGDYEYQLVWADDIGAGTMPPLESTPSATLTGTIGAGQSSLTLSNLPTTPPVVDGQPIDEFTHLRVYRRTVGGAAAFNYVGQVAAGTTSFDDTMSEAVALGNAEMDTQTLSGNYSYYVTFGTAGEQVGANESRPSPISDAINIVNGRVVLDGLPAPPAGSGWNETRVYRSLSTDSNSFHYVGAVSTGDVFVDNLADDQIASNAELDLDGPKIKSGTLLVDVLSRDGSTYNQVFEEGTLHFTGKKGGRALESQEFEIGSETTVLDLITFMNDALGIQSTVADPVFGIPTDQSSGRDPGSVIIENGRIILTGNNGVDNAIDIGLSGMLLETDTGTENVNMPWGVLEEAKG